MKLSGGLILYYIYTQYYTQRHTADIFKYYDDSLVLYHSFFKNPIDFFKIILGLDFNREYFSFNYYMEMNNWDTSYKNSLMNESRLLIKINAILNLIGFKNYFFNSITFILMGFVGEVLIFKSLIKKFEFKYPKFLFWSIVLFPSIFLWSSGILKEPMIIFSFGLILNSLIPKRKWANISSFIVAILIIFKVKFYIFICVFPALISYIISEKTKLKPPRIIFTICVIMAVIIFALGKMNNNYNPLKILSQKQNDFITLSELFDTGSAYKITPIEPSITSLLKAIPKGVVNGFFRPFPNNINNLLQLFPLIENLLLYLMIAYLFFKMIFLKIKINQDVKNILWNSLFFITMLFILIGISTPVIGALVRYKVPGLLFLIIVINLMYDQFKKHPTK
ncbi:MAG: hypothetical protein CL841_01445 [Crocinitomicaceae bacterium]|nr:hypothetical protein [Crocinitomicaceae bacterium]